MLLITFQPVKALNLNRLQEALNFFEGTHDFRYFSKPEKDDKGTILTIEKTDLKKKNGILYLSFTGKNFLRYQVRFLVGACLRYEQNRLSKETIMKLLDGVDVPYPKLKAEPQALLLNHLFYPELDKKEKFNYPLTNLLV